MEIKELVLLAKKGDKAAYEELYECTNKRAYYLALKLLQNEDDAMDILQDSYIVAFRSLDNLKNPEAFSSWFSQIVANRSKNLLRSRNRFVKPTTNDDETNDFFENIEDVDDNFLPESVVDNNETRHIILNMIDDLPNDQRESIMLYYFSGLSTEQIAKVQECSTGTVKSRLNYARKKLKENVLLLEKKANIRLHTFVPFGLIFTGYKGDIPINIDFAKIWSEISNNIVIGITGTGIVGTVGKTGSVGIKKMFTTLSTKVKILITSLTTVTVATGVAVAVLRDPIVEFHSKEFETAFAQSTGLKVGEIHKSDLESVEDLYFYEDKIYTENVHDDNESPYKKALANQGYLWPTVDLTDLQLFENLDSVNLSFVTIENPQSLSELDLKYLSMVQVNMENWDAINNMSNLFEIFILLPNVTEGVLDFSNFSNLKYLNLTTDTADTWESEFVGLETLKELKIFSGMTYEGAPDLSFLNGMTSLEWCDLKMYSISGLSNFSNLTNLKSLYLIYVLPGENIEPIKQLPSLKSTGIVFDSNGGYSNEEYWFVDGKESNNSEMIDYHSKIRKEINETLY